ncbi:MAG: DUF4783 domain-containing protein [Chitinophagales bacterium]|nr:DUF4783 domain-containing protein [Chitinophagales bacterium]MDW8420001.1 DUF4783 domain-containing protein [Chitinophagales bacterium]
MLIFALGVYVTACAQSFNEISNAIKQGNASALASFFQSNVEITIKDASNSYSKSQAEIVIKNFFSSNQPRSFSIAHEGTSPEGSKYFIGNLSTSGGNYRMYVYAKTSGGSYSIQEIRIEAQ